MDTVLRHDAQGPLLMVCGDVDIDTKLELVSASLRALQPPLPLRLDLGHVQFIDSIGLGALILIKRSAADAGCALMLIHASKAVEHLLDLTRMRDALLPR